MSAGESVEHIVESAPVDTLRRIALFCACPAPRAGMWRSIFPQRPNPRSTSCSQAQDVLAYDPGYRLRSR